MRCQKCGQDNLPGVQFCTTCGTALTSKAELIALPGQNAGFWIRIAASGLDSLIIAFVALIINLPKLPVYRADPFQLLGDFLGWLLLGLVLYHWPLISLGGQTVGKRLFQIKIVNREDKKLGVGRAFLREIIGKPVTAALAVLIVVGIIAAFAGNNVWWGVGDSKRNPKTPWLDDWIARSKVVVTERYEAVKTSSLWWLLEFLPAIGSIIGLLLLWKKDCRKAWAIFWGGLFWYFVLLPVVLLILMLAAA